MKLNDVEIKNEDIYRIEQDNESLHLILKDELTDEEYDAYCDKLSVIYPNIIDCDTTIMWYPITTEKFIITF